MVYFRQYRLPGSTPSLQQNLQLRNSTFSEILEGGVRFIAHHIIGTEQIFGPFARIFAFKDGIRRAPKEQNRQCKDRCERHSGEYSQRKFHMTK